MADSAAANEGSVEEKMRLLFFMQIQSTCVVVFWGPASAFSPFREQKFEPFQRCTQVSVVNIFFRFKFVVIF